MLVNLIAARPDKAKELPQLWASRYTDNQLPRWLGRRWDGEETRQALKKKRSK